MNNRFLAFGSMIVVLLLGACILAVYWLAPWKIIQSASAVPASGPIIGVEPASGGPDTLVTLSGSGFPANVRVTVHLGPPNVGATPNSYGEGTTDSAGNLRITFKMPGTWPDGTPITEPKIIVVALVGQGETKGLAEFTYSQ